jgi:hypothetical protein
MAIETVRNILMAAGGVTTLVNTRVSPVQRAQDEALPCVVLTLVSAVPQNHLNGAPTLDANRVQLDAYADTYADAREVAAACRAALEVGGCVMDNEFDAFEPDVTEYRVSQDWLVWT